MAGEIKGLTGTPPTNSTIRTQSPEAGGGPASASSLNPSRIDQIIFTDTAVSLQKLDSLLRDLPIADGKRVGAIREEIAAGHYRIDDYRVADKFMAFEVLYHGASSRARSYAFA